MPIFFAETTMDVNFYDTQKHFQELLPEQGYILDFGCGSGRDTNYFLSQHFQVDAIDGSEEFIYGILDGCNNWWSGQTDVSVLSVD